ncbi:MAG: TetR-like C-terminal domain-containing protein [Candidatus Promineifilaceae bacterium]
MSKKRTLNRDKVIEKAAELADEAGRPDVVTLTALAAALNVRVPSLYNHISSLDDLQAGLSLYGGRLLIGRLREATLGQVGQEAILSLTQAYRCFAHDHPGLYPLLLRAPDLDDTQGTAVAGELLQLFLLLLASYGIQGDDALHAIRGLRAVVHGFISLEAAEAFKMHIEADESYRRAVETFMRGLERKA